MIEEDHAALVDKGLKFFAPMNDVYDIKPGMELCNWMMYLLGHPGLLEEAEILIENADCRDDPSLGTVLLSACTASPQSAIAERIAKKALQLKLCLFS
ncbi:hypothetical protein NC651_025208 [Populus alba x Populus x berolinensis]|nr:hypothetical protein NC651_025208 [Populus alba x Populus x berolinensis]